MRRILPFAAPCILFATALCSCGGSAPGGDVPGGSAPSGPGDPAERPLVAYTRTTPEAPDVPGGEGCAGEGWFDVAALYPDGRGRVLTGDHLSGSARISPDGRRIAFASGRGGRTGPDCGSPGASVYVMDADGSDQRRLTRLGGDSRPLEWSPDGQRVAFSRVEDGEEEVWAADAGEGRAARPERLVPFPAENLAFSPDGGRIAYVRAAPPGLGADTIWTADADGGNPERLLIDRRLASVSDLEFSPDGRTLAVSAVDPDDVARPSPGGGEFRIEGDGANVLALRRLDDRRPEELAKPGPSSDVSWTADGGHLVYLGREERPRLHAITPEGGEAALPEGASRVRTAEFDWGPHPLDARAGSVGR